MIEELTKKSTIENKLKTISIEDSKTSEDQNDIQNTKYQDMIYYKNDRDEIVKWQDWVQVDFFKAMSEMEKLDWTFSKNHIGFSNRKNKDAVLLRRKKKNEWCAEVPIFNLELEGVTTYDYDEDDEITKFTEEWDGYIWSAYSDNKTISDMMKLFFEEVPWFGMLNWKMERYNEKRGRCR